MGDIDDFLQAQIDSVIFAANDNSNTKFSAELGFVENWLAQNARKNGLDIFGFRHTIDNYFVKHAFNGHGNEKQEAKRGQIAISESDYKISGTSDAYTLSRHPTLYVRNDTSLIKIINVNTEKVKQDT